MYYYVTVISEVPDFKPAESLEKFREAYPGTRKSPIYHADRGVIAETILHKANHQPQVHEFASEDGLAMYNLYTYLLESTYRTMRNSEIAYHYDGLPRNIHIFAGALPAGEAKYDDAPVGSA